MSRAETPITKLNGECRMKGLLMKAAYIVLAVVAVVFVAALLGRRSSSCGTSCMPADATDEDIRALAQQDKKIEAIKWYRTLHGVGLKEAKDAVERMIQE
jgi:ribosomal protein L7/L12